MGNRLRNLLDRAFPAEQSALSGDPSLDPEASGAILQGFNSLLVPVMGAYRRRYQNNGATPKGVFWSSAESVRKRFEVLCRVFDPEDIARGESTITDLGCGYGALYDFIKTHPVIRGGEYRGYDICESLLDACKMRIKDPRASFHLNMRATLPADYSLVSGTFNLSLNADDTDWLRYVQASLKALWHQTDKALAFNMLGNADAAPMDGLYYADPKAFAAFCRDNFSDNVTVVSDYGLPDFTIYVRR